MLINLSASILIIALVLLINIAFTNRHWYVSLLRIHCYPKQRYQFHIAITNRGLSTSEVRTLHCIGCSWLNFSIYYPRDAMLARVLAVIVCLSVRLSVTSPHSTKMAKRRITQTKPHDSPGSLVFWRQTSLVGNPIPPSPPEICAQIDPLPFRTQRFRPIAAHSTSTVRASEKFSISTNRNSTTHFPTSHRWIVYVIPKSPKWWHKTRFCCFCQ